MAQRSGGSWIFPAVVAVFAGAAVALQARVGPLGVWAFVLVLSGWVITLCLHEFAHAVVALAGGDISVRARGYLTLNPLRYTDLANSIVIPIILLAIGGIPLPGGAVLVEPHRLRRTWFASLVSGAGPVTNLVCGVALALAAAPLTTTPLGAALSFLALLQFVAALLNLLPVPGFDGFGVLEPFLSRRFVQRIRPIRPWAPLIVFAILFSVPAAGRWLFDIGYDLYALAGGNLRDAALGNGLFRFWS